jgi:hypothetical protein
MTLTSKLHKTYMYGRRERANGQNANQVSIVRNPSTVIYVYYYKVR